MQTYNFPFSYIFCKNSIHHNVVYVNISQFLRIQKEQKWYWYSYAIQKKGNIYYVYESEIAEENMAREVWDYENVYRYSSLENAKKQFPHKYGTCFDDIHTLKGTTIFNVDFYS